MNQNPVPVPAPPDLATFVEQLRRRRELAVIDAPVDPHLELAEVHRRVIAAGGPALLFRHVKGSRFPVVSNLFGTAARVSQAFGDRPGQFIQRLVHLVHQAGDPGMKTIREALPLVPQALRIGVSRLASGPVLDRCVTKPNLEDIPFTTSWPEDGGGFLTLPLVYTQHPVSGKSNLGMYRLQRHDPSRTGLHWQIGKGGGFHFHEAELQGRELPVTIHLGGPPAAILAAIAPLPEDVPELLLASLMLGRRFPLTRKEPHPIPVMANAEIALLGAAVPGIRHPEGPFGDHYGYYSLQHDYPVFECRQIVHRAQAVVPATVVGKPRQEDFYIGDFLQELLAPIFPLVMPGVRDLWAYGETGYHSLAAAVVRERYPREAMVQAFRILGEGQLSLTKFLLLVDRRLDLKNIIEVLTHVLERARFETDLYIFSALSMDTLDYTGPEVNRGSKGVLLGLGDPVRELPRAYTGPDIRHVRRIEVFSPGCLVIEGNRFEDDADQPAALAGLDALADWPLVVLVDDARRAVASPVNFLWTTFTRFEPAADMYPRSVRVIRHHLAYKAPIVIDARMKPGYPAELFCDEETAACVSRRWREYFPTGGVEMGSSDLGHLAPIS